MITYKPIIIQGGRRRDGTFPVKIRVTFKGVTRRLPTTLVCTESDLTRSGREGVPPFTFYAARHSFATLARRLGVEKATVDEALAHIGDYRVTDIYAERNWSLAWEANRKVLDLFRWPGE